MTIGERIKARRNELKLSQRELSDKMGYSNHSTIGKIENGKVDIPQSRIVQFAEVLGVSRTRRQSAVTVLLSAGVSWV